MRTKAIILKKQATKEYDQLITCYTQELGKLTAVAKSSLKEKSIQGMHLDVLNFVDFDVISGRATPIITGAQSEITFSHIRSSLPHVATAYFFLEVVDRIAYEHQKDEKLWHFLSAMLVDLESIGETELMPWFRIKQAEFLNVLGYSSQLASLATDYYSLDAVFEATFGMRLHSIRFLYQVL